MDEANIIHYKTIICAIGYVIDTRNDFFHMKPEVILNGP